jgi:hypothetical protein
MEIRARGKLRMHSPAGHAEKFPAYYREFNFADVITQR